jgi:hypothetical protein
VALRFISIRAWEGNTRRRAGRCGGGSGVLRKKEGIGWAKCLLGRRGEKTIKKVGWAARMTELKWKIGFRFDFPNFISRI